METIAERYGLRRVHEETPKGARWEYRLSDRVVELGARERELYEKIAWFLPSSTSEAAFTKSLGKSSAEVERLASAFADAGLLYRRDRIPASVSGLELHGIFTKVLESWLAEAFSHPFWERMMSGRGSKRLFTGWLLELYHYTKNANRHMPLSCAYTREKGIKLLRAKHYAEEWNHYHYFMKALRALGFKEPEVAQSVPLPMTLALSNFMRQAAREDVLCYSICSAVLEGTTTNRGAYSPYYETTSALYGIPREAIAPIFAHLDLDVQYGHSDLFREILEEVDDIPAARAGRILDYGHQLAELVWLWTDAIERHYEDENNPLPRRPFDPFAD